MQGEEVRLCGVTVSPTTVIGRTASVRGTVILTGPAPADGINVELSSDNPDVVKVPSSVDVPEGSNSAGFAVNTEPVNDPTPVAITASTQDVKQATTLSVQPPTLAQLTLNPAVVLGGATVQGTVQFNGPAPANFAVALQSTDTAVATVPASVTVPAGSISATFQVNARPVSSTRQANIVASRGGVVRSATLAVRSPAPVSFAFSPQLIESGATSTGTITLSGPAPGGTAIALIGSNATTADFPAAVPVQPGATEVTFTAAGKTFTGADRSVTITASYLGGVQSATLTVEGETVLSSVTVNPATVIGRTASVQGTVTLSGPAPAGGVGVTLSSDNPAVVRVPPSVNVPPGSAIAQFQVSTEPVSNPTPVRIIASSQGVQQTATLSVQPPALAQLALNPASVLGGATVQGTVQLNGPAPANFAIALQSTDAAVATVPAQVTVPQNAASATFSVSTRPVPVTRQVVIVASRAGVAKSATLSVRSLALVAFAFSPELIESGGTSTGAITLSSPAPSGTSVMLTGSNATTAVFPATVLVQPSATQVTFTAEGRVFFGADRSVTITASYLGGTRSATLTVEGAKGKEKEAEKAGLKEKEDEFLIFGRPDVESPGTDEESDESGGTEEGPAPGHAFVQPAERPVAGRQALEQPPAEEEG